MDYLYPVFPERVREKKREKEVVVGDSCRVSWKSGAPEVICHLSLTFFPVGPGPDRTLRVLFLSTDPWLGEVRAMLGLCCQGQG